MGKDRTLEIIKTEIERLKKVAHLNQLEYFKIGNSVLADSYSGGEAMACEILSFLSTLESGKPMDLEDEISRTYHDGSVTDTSDLDHVSYENIARHFYDLGCRRTAEKYDEIEYNRQREEGRVLPGFEDEPKGIPGKDFVPVDWVETLERYGKWKIVKLEEDGSSESVPNDLEEAAQKYLDELFGKGKHQPFYKELFIAGAEWQENKGHETIKLAEDHAFLAGADWQKERIMKGAVEGEVCIPNVWVDHKEGKELVVRAEISKELGFKFGDKVRIIIVKED